VPAAVGAALAALRIIRSAEGPPLFERVLDNATYLNDGLHALGFHVVEPTTLPSGRTVTTPIVPVLVADDWKAVLLWRALYDAGVYVNVALHPRGPAGRCAAAHERHGHARPPHARPRARRLRPRQGAFEAEHGPLPSAVRW
jgi:8-amino-7-oxononanoate synthase